MTSGGFVSLGRVKASDEFKSKLFRYALEGKAKKIEILFANNPVSSCDIDSCNTRGQSSLFVTCMSGHQKCATILLQLGANPNRRSDDGSTPCHAAAFSCHTIMLEALVDHGGDLRLHDNRDLMPRDWAVEAGAKRNKKMLELINTWQEQTTKKILSSNYSGKLTTSCSTKSLGANSKPPSIAMTSASNQHLKRTGFLNGSFGDFVAMEVVRERSATSAGRHEVGYKSIIPVVNSQHLNCIENELAACYNVPPYFTLCHAKWGNQNVTVKGIRKMKWKPSWQHASTTDLLIAEQKIHSLLRHNHILLLMGISFEGGNNTKDTDSMTRFKNSLLPQQLVYERVELGTVYHLLHEKKISFPISDSVLFLIQGANALSYIHQRGLIHCCVSSHAMYIVDHNTAKLSDLYYTVHSDEKTGIPTNQLSSAFNRWLSPEILAEKKPSFDSDTYSYCVLVCELLSGVLPWKGFDPDSIRHQIVSKGRVMSIPENIPDQFYSMLNKGLSISRRKRTYNIQSIAYQLQQFLESDNVLQGYGSIKTTQDYPMFKSRDMLIDERNERNYFKPYGDLPDTAPYDHQSITERDNSQIMDQNYIKVTPIRAATTALVPSGLQNKLKSSFTSKPPIPAAVRNILTDHCIHQPENSTKNNTLSSVKVSVHNGPVPQRSPASQNRSMMMERFLSDETGKLSHSLDEDLAGVHPDLMDTDSRDSSLNGGVQPSLSSCFNNRSHENQEYPVTPTYCPLAKEQIIKVTARTPSGSNQAENSERSSPYPDLSERQNSPGEYVLSGLPPTRESSQHVLDEEKSTMSFTSSYLAQVYASKSESIKNNSAVLTNAMSHKKNSPKEVIGRENSISNNTETTIEGHENRKSNDENLQTSMDKVYNSFVELSRMITPRDDAGGNSDMPQPEPCENAGENGGYKALGVGGRDNIRLETAFTEDEDAKNYGNEKVESYDKEARMNENELLDSGSLMEAGAEDFFHEVISAAGIDYSGKDSNGGVKNCVRHDPRPQKEKKEKRVKCRGTNNKEQESGISTDTKESEVQAKRERKYQRQTSEKKPKGSKAKVRSQRKEKSKFPSVQVKSEVLDVSTSSRQHQRKKRQRNLEKFNLNASTGKVEVLFSNFPSDSNQRWKKNTKVDDVLDEIERQIEPEFDEPALDAELKELMRGSRGLVTEATRAGTGGAPFPSGGVANMQRRESRSPDLTELFGQFANRNSQRERRFSMTSNDLEIVFADFANRKNLQNSTLGIGGSDTVDGPVVKTTSEPVSQHPFSLQTGDREEKLQVTRASQTSETDVHYGQCDKFSQTDSNKKKPQNPPKMLSFIEHATLLSSECSVSPQAENVEGLAQQLECGIENLNRPFDILSLQNDPLRRSTKKRERAIVPASHLQPISSDVSIRRRNPLSASSSQTSPRYIQTEKDLQSYQQITVKYKSPDVDNLGFEGSGCPSDSGKSLDKTPSKWSFLRKMSVFEAKSQNQTEETLNQVSATVLARKEQTPKLNIDSNAYDTESENASSSENEETKNEEKMTQTCDNASGDSHNIMYTTALEGTDQQPIGTPANLPRIQSLINTENAKTSTPVYHKPFPFVGGHRETVENSSGQRNLDASYGKLPTQDDRDSNEERREMNFAPGLLNLDQSSYAGNNSSILQMSMIPRSVNLPDVSTQSDATFGEESQPTPNPRRVLQKIPIEDKSPGCGLEKKTEFGGNAHQSLLWEESSAMSIGIGQLSTMLADEAIDKESKILLNEKLAEESADLSRNFSGISFDETPANKGRERCNVSTKSTNEKQVNGNVDCDTSVWAESHASTQIQEQHYQVPDNEKKIGEENRPHDDATRITCDPWSGDEDSYDEDFEDDIEDEERSSSVKSEEYSDDEH